MKTQEQIDRSYDMTAEGIILCNDNKLTSKE